MIISVVTFILILTFMLDLVVKEKKGLMVGSRVWLEQVFLSLVMEKLKKKVCSS